MISVHQNTIENHLRPNDMSPISSTNKERIYELECKIVFEECILPEKHKSLDEIDARILEILQKDCRTRLEQIASKLGVSKSTVHYRIKKLEAAEIIEGYYARVDATKIGKDFITVSFVRTRYGPKYHEKVGEMLAQIPGVWAVYFVFGEADFIVLTKSDSNKDFMEKLETIMNMQQIERTNTQVVAKVVKEDPRIELKYSASAP
jgi:Lrp/AsnC family leucine-responsive transcriptional regulator